MSKKIQILDPMSCLCKLGLLAYYPLGTKISITNNIITFQEPDNIQWVKRTYNGDGKNDISILYNPILKAIRWYIILKQNDKNDISLKAVTNIIKYGLQGLEKLEYTYNFGIVTLAIKFIKLNLRLCIEKKMDLEQFIILNELEEEDNVINYSKIQQIWKKDKIELISQQFNLLQQNKNDDSAVHYLIKSIKSQLMETDFKFQELVKTMNTSL